MAALESPETAGRILEVGGRDVLTYAEMMTGYARARGLKRWLIAVPVLTPRLSSYWVHLITPIPARIAQPLIKGLGNEVIVRDATARQLFPSIALLDYETAVRQALEQMKMRGVETAWSDALISSQGNKSPVALLTSEGMQRTDRETSSLRTSWKPITDFDRATVLAYAGTGTET